MGLLQQINNSGFPLQLAVGNVVRASNSGWRVLYEEHEWSLEDRSGFIDLVLEDQYKTWIMNVECKRVRNASWIFLRDKKTKPQRLIAKLWITQKTSNNKLHQFDWLDIPMDPESPQSPYCVVPGQDGRSRPMLEKTASSVVLSTEALAKEEALRLSPMYSDLRIYQNVIVTTANLKVCAVDIDKIDLDTGELDGESEFIDVPYVRFRKQLGATAGESLSANEVRDIDRLITQKESTVFVVNSKRFGEFLNIRELPGDLGRHVRAR